MNQNLKLICCCIFYLTFLNSCSKDEGINAPIVVDYPEQGLLGKPIEIELNNIHEGNYLQVFFDLEESAVLYISDSKISVVIPRSITSNTPNLKIIDLITNETILDVVISLKTPEINSYSATLVTFDEIFTIYGNNFDELENDIKIYVNDNLAEIINTNYNEVQIKLPYAINNSNLLIKVEAQRQIVNSSIELHLKNPNITSVQNSIAWINSQFIVNGTNFNPNYQFGEVLLNGVPCYFTATNTQLSISTPPGRFNDFQINTISYKTAGLTSDYATNIPIGNDAIMVDYNNNQLTFEIFVHNNKAYNLIYTNSNPTDSQKNYVLMEFSSITERWTQLNSFYYSGTISDALYDGVENLYIYKYNSSSETFLLSKLNMNTFVETPLSLPYDEIYNPIIFAYQSNLYILSGLNRDDNDNVTTRTEKYKYSEASNSWTTLNSSDFSELPLVSTQGSGKCRYLHFNNSIFLNYGINFKTYKVTSANVITQYNYKFSFGFQNTVIGRFGNGTSETLYNIATNGFVNVQNDIFGYGNTFFVLNNKIYFLKNSWSVYYPNTYFTQKLRTSIINGIL